MTHTPHGLAEDLPDLVDAIREKKEQDAHFARLVEDYQKINEAVHLAETDVEPTDDLHMNEMRKKRMALKDEIFRRVSA
ncbi:hypothetical protein C8N32_10158 [Rhodovulum imhoffii]|uniref:DUF465 domain-containing protein n=1 Tax=Rhodovulum imhoffii TaxID=365340 RepID=A0A2T5BW52_9RHOB|nr:YdcH family protein [Rhodovulum imhoffii]MBK5935168.1 hypothetical protein [Rhodovulum imhoffii]PTN03864.1 hypothetical protein C8N32_10158 [Rhodovulum imhoffii]